jgi:hypothetical protein
MSIHPPLSALRVQVQTARSVILMGRELHDPLPEKDAPLADRYTLLSAFALEPLLQGKLYEKVFTIVGERSPARLD